MKIGVVGLPNVGKSSLFNAITNGKAESANYPFCTIEPNVGIVDVPDPRLKVLGELYHTQKITPATIEFVDIAGLVGGASHGEGLGNKFLSHIRECDAIVHVVRCFESEKIIHVNGSIDPKRDIETIETELAIADLEQVDKFLDKNRKLMQQTGDKTLALTVNMLSRIKEVLEKGGQARMLQFSEDEQKVLKNFALLTAKPVIFVANVDENGENGHVQTVREIAKSENAALVVLCAKIEEELVALEPEERELFKAELGIDMSGLEKLVVASYDLLGLQSFLTAGEKEVRAWTITKGTKAPQAAGKIHSDFEKGFIKAEVVSFDDLVTAGNFVKAKEKGKVRIEGKDYVLQDGDVVLFRFNN